MPLNNVFHHPSPAGVDTTRERQYFVLWLLVIAIENFLQPDTRIIRTDGDMAQLQKDAAQSPGTQFNYLDTREVANVLSPVSEPHIAGLVAQLLPNFDAVYKPALQDFAEYANTIGIYPVDHGCASTSAVLSTLT